MLVAVVADKPPNHQAVFHYFYIISILDGFMKKISKIGAKKQIQEFFRDIKNKTPKEVKKIKKLAMNYNLPLKDKRKLFCKKCFTPYKNQKIRIKNGLIRINCGECGYTSRWKIK